MMSFCKRYLNRTVGLIASSGIVVITACWVVFHAYASHVERVATEKCEAMTPGERRESFIRSLIELKKRNAELSNRFAGQGVYRVGIAHNFTDFEARHIVAAAYESSLSFERNFDVTRLDVTTPDVVAKWNDKDALVSYSTHQGTVADFIPFPGVIEVAGVGQTGEGVGRFISRREMAHARYHVFSMKNISVVRDCCGGHERASGLDDSHVKHKLAAYRQTKAFFSSEFNGRDLYINASSCGIPSTRDGDNNMDTRRLNTFMIIIDAISTADGKGSSCRPCADRGARAGRATSQGWHILRPTRAVRLVFVREHGPVSGGRSRFFMKVDYG